MLKVSHSCVHTKGKQSNNEMKCETPHLNFFFAPFYRTNEREYRSFLCTQTHLTRINNNKNHMFVLLMVDEKIEHSYIILVE